ncbi:ribonuclease H-like domain-containing protein [Candidatus Woesearchaeota archaeon]|nr:ribonuclease H-like domain-containing protein [Candidatus Woesearchaeota archaeon]
MIRRSFIFLDRISAKTEKNLWNQGIKGWQDFLGAGYIQGLSMPRKKHYDRFLLEAQKRLYNFDSAFFKGKLPSSETWRLYDFFKDQAAFLDIETSGLEENSYITMIGIFDGIECKPFIRGINLDAVSLAKELSKYKLLVTFNGSTFDLPIISKKLPGALPDVPHIDLRHACAKVGLKGGLKSIERELGIRRSNPIIERMYGGDAITMWRMFRGSGDEHYLRLLVEYNEEDCINMKSIANKVYERLCQATIKRMEKENYNGEHK